MHRAFFTPLPLAIALSALATAQTGQPLVAPLQQDRPAGSSRIDALGRPEPIRVGRVPIHTAEPDGGKPYGIWAATDSYKASFHGDVTFVPYLGADRPENLPVAWHSQSVRIGDAELLDRVVERRRSDHRFEIACGRVTEAWDVLEHGLEQTFVIRDRPAALGDLVVRGRITTPLHASDFAAEHRAIDFADHDGSPVVRYGAAVAIDANGNRFAATTSFAAGTVELRVASSWLEAATFPIVIDPLLTRVSLSPGLPPESIDIARDDTGNDLMTVFTRAASASDFDAFAVLTTDAWTSATTVFTDVNTWSTPHVKVAVAASPQKYCVVLERQLPDRRIRAHLHDSNDFTLTTTVIGLTPAIAGSHDWRPDVGGQVVSTSAFTSTGSKFLIVFQRDVPPGGVFQNTNGTAIFGRTLDANGTLGTEFPIALGVLQPEDYEFPCVNQQARRSGSAVQRTDWLVVFQRYIGTGATWRTVGKLVSDTGTLDPNFWSSSSSGPTNHQLTPHVAGQLGRYLVSYVETAFALAPFKTTATSGHSNFAERVDWSPGAAPVNYPQRHFDGPGAQPYLAVGDVAYDTDTISHWAITVQTLRNFGGSGRATVLRTGFQGLETERQILYDPISVSEQGIAGGICFDSDAGVFVAAFGREASSASGTVYGNKFTYDAPAPLSTFGASCSSASISWVGSQQIGAEFPSIRLTSAPGSLPAIAAVSLGTLDVNLSFLGMLGCRLLIDNAAPNFITTFATVTSASGSASIPIPLPETLPNANLYFQWFHFDIGANPLDLVSTQRIHVNIVK